MKKTAAVAILTALMLVTPAVAETSNSTGFQIVTVEGEDASKVNEIKIGYRDGIEVGLENADYENAKFVAYLDGQEMFMGDDEEISIRPDYKLSTGKQELRIERQSRREEDVSRTTMIDIREIDRERDDETNVDSEDMETVNGSDSEDFAIATVKGQDADQVNGLDVEVGENVDIGLEGAEFEEDKLRAFIDGTEMHVEEGGVTMVRDIKNVGKGQHELKLQYYYEGEGTLNASTQIDIKDIEEDRDLSRSEPGDFKIESIAGQEADRVNDLELSEGDRIDFELDGIDRGKYRFEAFIDGIELPAPEDGIVLTSKVGDLEEGSYTLRIASIFDDEEATDAETEVEVTDVETREEKRMPDELDTELYDPDFNPDVEGQKVERNDGSIVITATEESLSSDDKVVVGDSIEDLTEVKLRYKRGAGGLGGGVKLKIEKEDPSSVENEDMEVYSVLELSGQNLELIGPVLKFAVENEWADQYGFDEAARERGGSRGSKAEIAFYDVEEDWQRMGAYIRDTTSTHSIYHLQPFRLDEDMSLESKTNTIAIGGNPEGGLVYAVSPQGQCESFKSEEEIPSGYEVIEKSCIEREELSREKEQLRGRINDLMEDIKGNEDRGSEEHVERLQNATDELEKGNIDRAEQIYEEVQKETAKSFLRGFIIKVVQDILPF
ncbi:MAG: hypothetical protein MUP58_00545 [Candidatus Nanohaloarchaeota archaeon QJJ-9]|nr:hypothetical protein [Candidatus Nanohaloarchaeota archaeon QJJ-9]